MLSIIKEISVKKLLLLIILSFAGYKAYTTYFISPLIGEWQPDKEFFLHKAYESGVTAEQESFLIATLDKLKLSITKEKIKFTFPNMSGEFDYKADKTSADCYNINIKDIGHSSACLKDGKLEMTNIETGSIELFNKVS